VFVFVKGGAFVASARAPLDYQELTPGDESPFTVTVPNVSEVARYRVSFRNDRDVVSHVDRRPPAGSRSPMVDRAASRQPTAAGSR
jgi:hypothetical protein